MSSTPCSCSCHPHTQWGPDGSVEQRENHADQTSCVCCPITLVSTQEISAEGFFASEQDAIAEEAAWADQMASESASAEVVPVAAVDEDEGPDAPVNPLDIPDAYDLPIYGSVQACIKCGLGAGTDDTPAWRTEYHPAGVLGKPCGETFGWPQVQNLGEHLCLTCTRCKYGFPMAVWRG